MMEKNTMLTSYILGFALSLVLTLVAYFLTTIHLDSNHVTIGHEALIFILLILAFVQLLVQLIFFLHMLKESKPRWNLIMFLSFVSIIFIIVVGSLWIMQHLNYMMPHHIETKILKNELMIGPGYSDVEKQKSIQERTEPTEGNTH